MEIALGLTEVDIQDQLLSPFPSEDSVYFYLDDIQRTVTSNSITNDNESSGSEDEGTEIQSPLKF